MAPVVLPLLVLASLALAVAPSAVTGGADGMSAQVTPVQCTKKYKIISLTRLGRNPPGQSVLM